MDIQVVSYDPEWKFLAEGEIKRLSEALGVEVHHVGSTAVPGLSAKPTIDLLMIVEDFYQVEGKLEPLGYVEKGEYTIPGSLYFRTPGHEFHIHAMKRDHSVAAELLGFRDSLIQNPDLAKEYSALKACLISQSRKRSDYTKGKNEFIQKALELLKSID